MRHDTSDRSKEKEGRKAGKQGGTVDLVPLEKEGTGIGWCG